MVDAGIRFDDVAFWWKPYGAERGLWNDPPEAARLIDSWADADAAIADIDHWLTRPDPLTYYEFILGVPSSITSLAGAEIVGLWSLAS
jgi:hypothetical protein